MIHDAGRERRLPFDGRQAPEPFGSHRESTNVLNLDFLSSHFLQTPICFKPTSTEIISYRQQLFQISLSLRVSDVIIFFVPLLFRCTGSEQVGDDDLFYIIALLTHRTIELYFNPFSSTKTKSQTFHFFLFFEPGGLPFFLPGWQGRRAFNLQAAVFFSLDALPPLVPSLLYHSRITFVAFILFTASIMSSNMQKSLVYVKI